MSERKFIIDEIKVISSGGQRIFRTISGYNRYSRKQRRDFSKGTLKLKFTALDQNSKV